MVIIFFILKLLIIKGFDVESWYVSNINKLYTNIDLIYIYNIRSQKGLGPHYVNYYSLSSM